DFEFYRFFFDLRNYLLISRRSNFAFRFMSGYVSGTDRNEFKFKIGGASLDSNFPNIRGYSIQEFSGLFMHLINIEYRTTFIDLIRLSFPFPIQIRDIDGVIFLDMGATYDDFSTFDPLAWNNRLEFQDIKSGFGFGLRFILIYIPCKIDFATPFNGHYLRPIGKWTGFFSIGFDF
ncbi:BamA/TamA family outer membrane protein, partial [Spirochaetota bacterium]